MKTVALTASMNESDFYLRRRYTDWLARAGLLSVILPPTLDRRIISGDAERFDGFLFTGGDDVDPQLYGEEKQKACGEIHRLRDEFEIALIQEVVKLDKPILGICRGIQVMNVAMGGTLWQDISESGFGDHAKEENGIPRHTVSLTKKGKEIFGTESIVTNSYHHQSVKSVGRGLEVIAQSSDGLVEGIWHGGLRFFCGVQWHPEMKRDEYSMRLLEAFVSEL